MYESRLGQQEQLKTQLEETNKDEIRNNSEKGNIAWHRNFASRNTKRVVDVAFVFFFPP